MSEDRWLSLIAGLMVLVLVAGGLARRRLPDGQGVRLALLWAGIILIAALAASLGQKLLH